MRAAVYHGPQDIRVEDVPDKKVGDDDVLIKVKYCGVCGTDIHIYNGDSGSFPVVPPLIPGHEFSGVVVETGKNVTKVKVGDQKEIDIYRTPTGNYRIPRDSEQKLAKFLFIAIAVVGVVTAGLSRFVFSEPKRSAKRAGSRKKHRRREQYDDTDEMTDLTDRQRVRRSDRPRRKRRTKRSSDDQ